jgi:hypothetical protein
MRDLSVRSKQKRALCALISATGQVEMNDYRLPVTARRMIKSAKAATPNNDAASSRNILEVAESFGAFRLAISRITSNIPATASKVGQSGLSWLTISSFQENALADCAARV